MNVSTYSTRAFLLIEDLKSIQICLYVYVRDSMTPFRYLSSRSIEIVCQSSMIRWIWWSWSIKKRKKKVERRRVFFPKIDLLIDEMSDMWSTVAHFWTSSLRWEEEWKMWWCVKWAMDLNWYKLIMDNDCFS
jgi:hypothetical protein